MVKHCSEGSLKRWGSAGWQTMSKLSLAALLPEDNGDTEGLTGTTCPSSITYHVATAHRTLSPVVTFQTLSPLGDCVPIFRMNINAFSLKGNKTGKENPWLIISDALFFYKNQTCHKAAPGSEPFTILKPYNEMTTTFSGPAKKHI